MQQLLFLQIIIPLVGALLSQLFSQKKESQLFYTALITFIFSFLITIVLTVYWIVQPESTLLYSSPEFYHRGHTTFSIQLMLDINGVVYAWVSGFIGMVIAVFSRFYMHRDPGYKRFFTSILLFLLGLNLIIFSGNFEMLFMGWEIIGITSFLLIGFYRERYLPVKNAFKVVSLFRLSDVLLLVAVWMSHQAFGRSIGFNEMTSWDSYAPMLFILVAMIKSAQFPFSSWLARAMEGPTTSSAIFYGSLSVHIGVFLLIRVSPFWSSHIEWKILIASIGIVTTLIAVSITSVQSTIKTQIAYASVAQIGIMFIEVAFGYHLLALVHFAGNALLRSYQLLVSPSVLHYLIHNQLYHFQRPKDVHQEWTFRKLKSTLMILSIKEWNLDVFQFKYLWSPFKKFARGFRFLERQSIQYLLMIILVVGALEMFISPQRAWLNKDYLGLALLVFAFLLVIRAFNERTSALRAWIFLFLSQFFILTSVGNKESLDYQEIIIYLSGILIAGTAGVLLLKRIIRLENDSDLESYYGHIYEHPKIGTLFFLSCLGIVGFPLTPTFLGIDIILSHIDRNQWGMIALLGLTYLFMEIAALRIFSRLFLGPHRKVYHEIAFKSS